MIHFSRAAAICCIALTALPSCAQTQIVQSAITVLPPVEQTLTQSSETLQEPVVPVAFRQPESVNAIEPELQPAEVIPAPGQSVPGAENTKFFTLSELEQLALSNNPTLAQTNARVQAARGKRVQVGLKPNPVIGYLANEIGNSGAAGQQGAFISQKFITADKLGLNRQVVSREVARGEQVWAAQRQRVLTDLRLAYYRTLVAQRRLDTTKKLITVSDELVSRAETLLKNQEGSEVNLLQATTEAQTIRLSQIAAQNRLDVAWRQLVAVVSVSDLERVPLAGDPTELSPALTWEESLQSLRAQSPEVAAAAINVERARWAVSRAQAGRVPDVTGQLAVQYDDATDDTVTSLQFGVPLQIFDRNQGNIMKACAELREAKSNLERVEQDLMNRLSAVFGRHSTAQRQSELYSANVLPNARRALELVEVGYREGVIDYLTVLTTQRTYFQASLAHLDTILAAREASVEMEGLLLTGSLELP